MEWTFIIIIACVGYFVIKKRKKAEAEEKAYTLKSQKQQTDIKRVLESVDDAYKIITKSTLPFLRKEGFSPFIVLKHMEEDEFIRNPEYRVMITSYSDYTVEKNTEWSNYQQSLSLSQLWFYCSSTENDPFYWSGSKSGCIYTYNYTYGDQSWHGLKTQIISALKRVYPELEVSDHDDYIILDYKGIRQYNDM